MRILLDHYLKAPIVIVFANEIWIKGFYEISMSICLFLFTPVLLSIFDNPEIFARIGVVPYLLPSPLVIFGSLLVDFLRLLFYLLDKFLAE